jgi:cytochrome P450
MSAQAPLYDLESPAFFADPSPTWTRMRRETPVYQDPAGEWYLTRYDDCVAALHDLRLASDRTDAHLRPLTAPERSRVSYYEAMRRAMLLFVDPPLHTRLRRLVAHAFTPRTAEALRPRIQTIADELLAAAPAGDFDAMRDLALPLPFFVIADLIGLPRADRPQIKAWSTDFAIAIGGRFSADVARQANDSLHAFGDYLRPIVARLRAAPEPTLFSKLVAAEEQGDRLSEDELFATAMLLVIAGHETTTNLIANGLWLLLSHPDQLQRLRENPALIGTTVDEVLRYASPVQSAVRVAKEDVAIGAKVIRKGERASMLIGAANRDPAHFADPERFDIARQPNPHLGFGDYIHVCLGAALARVEGQVALGTLAQRYPNMRPVSESLNWQPVSGFLGLGALTVDLGEPSGTAEYL